MALSASDFIQPSGRLTEDLFPLTKTERESGQTAAEKLRGYVAAWIVEAVARTAALAAADRDEAGRQWVYHRAYDAVWQRLLISPVEARLEGQGQVKFSQEQILRFKTLAEEHLATFRSYVDSSTAVSRSGAPRSFALTAHARWYYDPNVDA